MPVLQDVLAWTCLVAFGFYVLAAAFTLSISPHSQVTTVLWLILILMAHWAVSSAISLLASDAGTALRWRESTSLGWGVVYSLIFRLCLLMTGHAKALTKRWVRFVLYAPTVVNVLVFLVIRDVADANFHVLRSSWGWHILWADTFWNRWQVLYWPVFGLGSVVLMLADVQRSKDLSARRLAMLIGASFVFSAGTTPLVDTGLGRINTGLSAHLSVVFHLFRPLP